MRNKNHIYCVFRLILDTYGIIMRNKNHIYCVFRIISDTYGIIMRNENHIYILSFSDYFRHLFNYNENENYIYFFFLIILDIYEIIMKIKITYIVFFGLFWTLKEL